MISTRERASGGRPPDVRRTMHHSSYVLPVPVQLPCLQRQRTAANPSSPPSLLAVRFDGGRKQEQAQQFGLAPTYVVTMDL